MTEPKSYTKKPVTIEAMQFDGTNGNDILDWVVDRNGRQHPDMRWHRGPADGHDEPPRLLITTLEGVMRADVGDYIIRGVQGEFYPCKPDIFAESYEGPAEEVDGVEWSRAFNAARERFIAAATGQPPTDEQRAAVEGIQDSVVHLAMSIEALVPEGRNKSLALTALEDVHMRANRAIFAKGPHW